MLNITINRLEIYYSTKSRRYIIWCNISYSYLQYVKYLIMKDFYNNLSHLITTNHDGLTLICDKVDKLQIVDSCQYFLKKLEFPCRSHNSIFKETWSCNDSNNWSEPNFYLLLKGTSNLLKVKVHIKTWLKVNVAQFKRSFQSILNPYA